MSLFDAVLTGVLNGAKAGLVAAGVPVPERSFLSHGKPPVDWPADAVTDDALLAVWWDRVSARPFGEGRSGNPGADQLVGIVTVVPVRVEYWACYPNLGEGEQVPDPAAMTTATVALTTASWAIWCELVNRANAHTLVVPGDTGETPVTRGDVGIGTITALEPQGAAAGFRITVEVGMAATAPTP